MGGAAKYVRLSQVTYPNGRQVHYGYGTAGAVDDVMSRLATIGDGTNTHASYKYLGAGRIVSEDYEEADVRLSYLNGSGNVSGTDRFGRVTDQVWNDYGANPATAIDRYTYSYDRSGNRTARDNELHSPFDEDYLYDGLDRLIDADRADSFDQSWTLDGLGNFRQFDDDGQSQTRTANAVNEITAITGGWATPAYDLAGNMTTIPAPLAGNGGHALGGKYDAWNRLVQLTDGGVLIAKFSYDAAGRRIVKATDSDANGALDRFEHFLHQDQQVVETRIATAADAQPEQLQPKYQFVWSPRYIDAPVLRDQNTDPDGLCDDARHYYLADANYNVTALVNASGDVVERYAYSAYGEASVYSPDWLTPRTASDYANTTLYTGRELDTETGLYYYRARYYSADLGNFVNRDPIGYDGQDFNLSRYVSNGPLNFVDPSGNQICSEPPGCEWPNGKFWIEPCTAAEISADNQAVLACTERISDEYYNPNYGVFAQLRQARDRDLHFWSEMEKTMAQDCIRQLPPEEQNGAGRANCEMLAYLSAGVFKKNVQLAYWTAANTARAMERIKTALCLTNHPCWGQEPGDQPRRLPCTNR